MAYLETAEGTRGGEGEGGRGCVVSPALRESEGAYAVETQRVEGDWWECAQEGTECRVGGRNVILRGSCQEIQAELVQGRAMVDVPVAQSKEMTCLGGRKKGRMKGRGGRGGLGGLLKKGKGVGGR